jgi:hypothetical protein
LDDSLGYGQILAALRLKRERIEEAILVIERLAREEAGRSGNVPDWLKARKSGNRSSGVAPAKKKRTISEAGRKRIAEATRKRWAAKRAADAAAGKTANGGTAKKATKKGSS